ncbi:SDR family oxidoreductase [candidate division KSB3 bacterium]|uniref:SDR family oxidoreductase n=1 Tax=candidate division KSB3 bacterium TaxID=2044937 RepID=A0A9D5JZB9_9BACT|nr:SDR family oxidoreductase [candidate division KSB3 bacterium]MBD3326883.1 SDR family oxidoreductase [candidate division KSB3 bacterium]
MQTTQSGHSLVPNLFSLEGKIALITGSSQGLGLILARGLGQAGATIVLNGRNQDKLNKTVAALAKEGFRVHGYAFDVTDSAQIQQAIPTIEQEVGAIDILVNNAGIQSRAPLETFDEATWRKILETNLTSVFLVTKQVVQGMIARKSGKIINICSLQSEFGRATIAPYTASKGGVKLLTKGMATDWGKYNIQVNGLGPGYFLTEMTQPLADNPQFDAWLKARTPMGRWGDPQELLGAMIFLASEASNFMSGQILYIDGGILATV